MAVLRESPWYQEIEQHGRREEILSNIEMSNRNSWVSFLNPTYAAHL